MNDRNHAVKVVKLTQSTHEFKSFIHFSTVLVFTTTLVISKTFMILLPMLFKRTLSFYELSLLTVTTVALSSSLLFPPTPASALFSAQLVL